MLIGSEEGQQAFQGHKHKDTFMVLDTEGMSVTLYQTVETVMRPSVEEFEKLRGQPYWWSEATGMMYVLKPVSKREFGEVDTLDFETAMGIVQEMEKAIEQV